MIILTSKYGSYYEQMDITKGLDIARKEITARVMSPVKCFLVGRKVVPTALPWGEGAGFCYPTPVCH